MSSARDDFLQRVRLALAEGGRKAALAAISPRGHVGYQGAGVDPVTKFVTQLQTVGATAHVVRDAEAVVRTIGELVSAKNARRILLGDSPFLSNIPLKQHLIALGMEVTHVDELLSENARAVCFAADVGISGVDGAIAETGTLVIRSGPLEPRSLTLLPPAHIAVVEPKQLLPDLFDLFDPAQAESQPSPSCLTLVTGPSKTGDIELRLVTGVHGPGEVHVILVDSSTTPDA
jgi:L-lactate dehydrogenase complex protein LldG